MSLALKRPAISIAMHMQSVKDNGILTLEFGLNCQDHYKECTGMKNSAEMLLPTFICWFRPPLEFVMCNNVKQAAYNSRGQMVFVFQPDIDHMLELSHNTSIKLESKDRMPDQKWKDERELFGKIQARISTKSMMQLIFHFYPVRGRNKCTV